MNTRRLAVLALLSGLAATATGAEVAEPLRPVQDVRRALIAAAFVSNLALARETEEVARAAAALDEARAHYLPEFAFEARYTLSDGGRQITLPTGELLNPAYQTLNELLVGQGRPPRFGMLTDPSIAFQRPREQDTRVTVRQPVYQPAIPAAVAAQRGLLRSAEFQRLAYAHQLHHDVSVAYLRHLRALRTVLIVQSAGELLTENLRVTQSLFANGRITEDQVLRARSELLEVQQQRREAANAVEQTRRYVNFLLNRPLATPLEDASIDTQPPPVAADLHALAAQGGVDRAELARLDALQAAARAQVDLARAALKPSLALGVDAGTQGEQYRTGPNYNFITGSVVLTWKLFDGGGRTAALSQARHAERVTGLAREELASSIELEVQQALESLDTSIDSLDTARGREAAARAALRIAARKRDEGAISQVEFIDARSALTQAELNLNLTQFSVLERSVELERATGSAQLPSLPPQETSR